MTKIQTIKRSAVAAAVAVSLAAGYALGGRHDAPPMVPAVQAAMMPAEAAAKTGIPDFSGLAETYGPAVVNISAKHVVTTAARRQMPRQMPVDPDDPFYQFFKHFYGDGQPDGGMQAPDRASMSLGSGFIVSRDGYILTNAHVVDGANVVSVKLTDKREYRAKVVGVDKQTDVAVLKIEAKDLPTVRIGDPSKSKPGQWVVAIGSPYGFTDTVTSGIISAKARSLPDETYVPFIQTDVPVNPGNSGGPLFNLDGEVIGINSMIYSQTGGFQGLSFAVPIDVAMKVKDELVRTGHVERGRIGVAIQEVNQALAKSFGMSKPEGALVASVERDGPAARAGLKAGDVILSVNGHAVDESAALPAEIANIAPGQTAKLDVWRAGRRQSVDVKVGSFADKKVAEARQDDTGQGKLGVAVRQLTPDERRMAGTNGLLVEQVAGPAANAGVQPGDVIVAVNGEAVTSVDQLKRDVARADGSLALLVERNDTQIFVPVDLG
ncbi:DegQ family serine endoprotease [Chitinasiproducens palmae]|uniref:Probable periplasmic serine endoprotease DegP-like n=1 Tax=Chitinasiproducens palmae TaxID=1770053 RepID=A0A1H2PXB9_9BURK|nr:DegQ family serine endoprotease [Chitinasiproducens palmae]SDV51619.1 serine protease Do [Chitinasiproducens palmae]